MTTELAKTYDPKAIEKEVYERWTAAGAFNAEPTDAGAKYCIVIPPPNVTAALHLGHALNNTLQDILIRVRRMQGYNALWMPGTDHAGIATQTVVDKRLTAEGQPALTAYRQMEEAGQDGRKKFVEKVQAWKDEYEARILHQLQTMGCSCDWRRTRFTMDEQCARAVRETFFKLFSDGLIYRGKRLVNWDPVTQTVLADDEVEHEDINGHFFYLKYPLVEPAVRGADILSASSAGVSPASQADIKRRRRGYLPHWTREEAAYAVTFRLADSLPGHILEAWDRERKEILDRIRQQNRQPTTTERKELHHLFSARVDAYLNTGQGACYLRDPRVADMLQHTLLHFDGERYDLLAWVIMPNHVHAVVQPLSGHELPKIMQSWKSFSAKEANKILGREGTFWQSEYYDHLIRDEEDFNHCLQYILDNPEKGGLKDWPFCGVQRPEPGRDAPGTRGQDVRATQSGDALATEFVTVATTRPETMLGDTAVAMNPRDPRAKDLVGKFVRLPIVGRIIPIIADEHVVLPDPDSDDAKARASTGFLKVTPAHDPDDYAIGQRHQLPVINVMAPDATISEKFGWTDWDQVKNPDVEPFIGLDRFEAREAIVEWFRQEDLLEKITDYTHPVGHSYRSHVPIEPYLSDQWYVAVKKPIPAAGGSGAVAAACAATPGLVEDKDGITYIKGTDVPVNSLAGLSLMPLVDGRLKFVPDRYANNYRAWLENLRDWPISRQLWWGHQIPVWTGQVNESCRWLEQLTSMPGLRKPTKEALVKAELDKLFGVDNTPNDTVEIEVSECDGSVRIASRGPESDKLIAQLADEISRRRQGRKLLGKFEIAANYLDSLAQDPDVLDTWFSSALWPFSTLGWPEKTDALKTWYPGDVLCTAREIITLWVSRMVMMGQYCLGDIPFHDVFIHAMIQDGQGRKMSKSLGNGIDPLDIIDSHGSDAMRFTLASMTTQTQDVRMPVEKMKLPDGREMNASPKFDLGRNFANKLWNASRFAMMNLGGMPDWSELSSWKDLSDRWILSSLQRTIASATAAIEGYRFNELADTLYHFMWDDFCDWYLEIAKSRINAGHNGPKAIVAHCLDNILRLLHPIMPFITEAIWQNLNAIVPMRGPGSEAAEPLLIKAAWPRADFALHAPEAEQEFEVLRKLIGAVRNVRTQQCVPPSKKLSVVIEATGTTAAIVSANVDLVKSQAGLSDLKLVAEGGAVVAGADAASIAVIGTKLYILDIIDRSAELTRLTKQADTLRKGIKGIEGKLGNEQFLAKAPPELVAKEKARLDGLQADLAAVEKSLESLR